MKCFSKRNRARRISGWGPRGTAETALELWAIVMKAIAFLLLFYFLFLLFLFVFITRTRVQGWCSQGKNIRTCVPTNHERQGLDLMALLVSSSATTLPNLSSWIRHRHFHRFLYATPEHYSVRSTIFMSIIMPMDGLAATWVYHPERIPYRIFEKMFEQEKNSKM